LTKKWLLLVILLLLPIFDEETAQQLHNSDDYSNRENVSPPRLMGEWEAETLTRQHPEYDKELVHDPQRFLDGGRGDFSEKEGYSDCC